MKVTPFPKRLAVYQNRRQFGSVLNRKGWLMFYTDNYYMQRFRYSMGNNILNERILQSFVSPNQPAGSVALYELTGDVQNVVFHAALQDGEKSGGLLWYADTVVTMAFGYIDEILELQKNSL